MGRDPACCEQMQASTTPAEAAPTQSDRVHLPWSGSALGLADLFHLTPRGRHILVAVLGSQDSGKTTLLLGSYLHLLEGGRLAGARFAGSRTLGAWEGIAAWTRFDDATRQPCFPPHTPRGAARAPGLLHLALRDDAGQHRDVLLADAPGEWFKEWAANEEDVNSEGARWVVQHADAFLVLADSERLAGSRRGAARGDLRRILERLGKHVSHRPIIFVWAKNEHKIEETMQVAIQNCLATNLPHAIEVKTSIRDSQSLPAALAEVLRATWTPPRAVAITAPIQEHHPEAAFRGHHAPS